MTVQTRRRASVCSGFLCFSVVLFFCVTVFHRISPYFPETRFLQKIHCAADLSEDEVKEFVALNVVEYKTLSQVEFIETIPKLASGKIQRKELREKEAEAKKL